MAEARGRGRPTKYSLDLVDQLPEMFANGESIAEVCVQIGIGRTTYYDWLERYPKFRRAHEEGQLRCEAFWMRIGRLSAIGVQKDVNATTWIFNMKNRFRWRDRPDPESTGEEEMTPEEYARRVTEALAEAEDLDGGGFGEAPDAEVDPAQRRH